MEKELPKGWSSAFVQELAEKLFAGGDVPKNRMSKEETEEYQIPIYGNGISDGGLYGYTDISKVDQDCITISARGTIGFPILRTTAIYPIVRLIVLVPHSSLDVKYIYYYLKSVDFEHTGTSIPQLTVPQVKQLLIPIAPYSEQKRLVDKLDALFGHLDTLKTKLDRIPELLKNFRQQVLTQAVTGKLTEEWREGRDLENEFLVESTEQSEMREIKYDIPINWCWKPFNRVAHVKSNLVQPLKYLDYPLIAPDNIQPETGSLQTKPLVRDIMPKSSKHYFETGSIVYSKIRPYLSKVILADFDGLSSADMYPIKSDLEIRYLYYYMLSNIFLRYATTAGERSVLPKINQKELGIIPVSVPSKMEQAEIVNRVDSLFNAAEKIESQYLTLKEKIDNLPQSILNKAFKGELVPQDSNDEPASKLLKRIQKKKGGEKK